MIFRFINHTINYLKNYIKRQIAYRIRFGRHDSDYAIVSFVIVAIFLYCFVK
jgi:hypothetical protein